MSHEDFQGVNEATPFLSFFLSFPRVSLIQAAIAMQGVLGVEPGSAERSDLDGML